MSTAPQDLLPNSQPSSSAALPGLMPLVAAQVCIHSCMAGMRMAAPLLALKMGHSAAEVGLLLALFALTQVFLSLPAGRFADQYGLRRPLVLCVGAACVGAALAAVWPIYGALCAAALLSGGATGSALIALQRHVGRMARNAAERRRVFSWLAIGPAFSNFAGPLIAGLVIDAAGALWGTMAGFRCAFTLLALLPLGAWWFARHTHEIPNPPLPEGENARTTAWDLLQSRALRRLLLTNWVLSACWDVHTFVVPLIGHERGLSASVIGMILGVFAAAAAIVRIVLPKIADRSSEKTVLVIAMLATGVLFGLWPLMPNAWAMAGCSALLGLTLGCVQPMVMSLLHIITPAHRQGQALGLRMMTINISSVTMPMIFGSVGTALGPAVLFWVVGLGVIAGARLPILLGREDLPALQKAQSENPT